MSSPSAQASPSPLQRQSVLWSLRSPRALRTELLAGLVVGLALIPEAIAFSVIAGVDPRAFDVAVRDRGQVEKADAQQRDESQRGDHPDQIDPPPDLQLQHASPSTDPFRPVLPRNAEHRV